MIASLNGATTRPYPLEEDLRAAAAAGFPMVELWGEKFENFFAAHSIDDLKRMLDQYSLRVTAIDLVALDYSEPQNVETAVARAHTLGAIAQAVDCDLLLLCSWGDLHGRSKAEGLALVAEYIQPVCIAAAEYGCRLAIEPLGGNPLIPGCEEALAIIEQAHQPNLGLMWDFFHYYKSGVPIDVIRRIPADKLWLVHADDVPDLPCDDEGPGPRLPWAGRVAVGNILQPCWTSWATMARSRWSCSTRTYYQQPIDEIAAQAFAALQPYLESRS